MRKAAQEADADVGQEMEDPPEVLAPAPQQIVVDFHQKLATGCMLHEPVWLTALIKRGLKGEGCLLAHLDMYLLDYVVEFVPLFNHQLVYSTKQTTDVRFVPVPWLLSVEHQPTVLDSRALPLEMSFEMSSVSGALS